MVYNLVWLLALSSVLVGAAISPHSSDSLIDYVIAITLPEPSENLEGLAYDGENLWVADPEFDRIFKISATTGAILATIPSPESDTALWGGPDGLAWDGEYLWVMADYNDKPHVLYQLDPADGHVVASFPSPAPQADGLTFDGAYLYLSDNSVGEIFIVDPVTGLSVDSFSVPGARVEDLAFDGTYLWMVDNLDLVIFKIDLALRQVVDQFDFPARGGLAWGGGYLWVDTEENILGLRLLELDNKRFLPAVYNNHTDSPGYQLYTDPDSFNTAITGMGAPFVIDFNEIDAEPVDNSYLGRTPFDGSHYSGIAFASPVGSPLYIAPGGLFWNASNSLSIERFPFDPVEPKVNNDSLNITYTMPCRALGLTLVDSEAWPIEEYIEFVGEDGTAVARADLPGNYTDYRAFIGIVTDAAPITKIIVNESLDDYDDITYDDLICVPWSP